MMKNKKGWMRIVEATMAVMIITGFVLTYTAKREKAENDLTSIITPVLEELAEELSIRNNVLSASIDDENYEDKIANVEKEIDSFVGGIIKNPNLEYAVRVCEINDICILETHPATAIGDIYAVERIISTTLDQPTYMPKKVKIFLWRIA